jgi:hypothetical protein
VEIKAIGWEVVYKFLIVIGTVVLNVGAVQIFTKL